MFFSDYSEDKTTHLTHKVELYEPGTGNVAAYQGRDMFLEVKGAMSNEYKKAVDKQEQYEARSGKTADTVDARRLVIARRLAEVTVSGYVALAPDDIIDFDLNKNPLSSQEHDQLKKRLRTMYTDNVAHIANPVHAEVLKSENFTPEQPKTSSPTSSNESGTTASPTGVTVNE